MMYKSLLVVLALTLVAFGAWAQPATEKQPAGPERPGKEHLQAQPGVLVGIVIPDSPAEKAGLKRGDIVLTVDGTAVNNTRDIKKKLLGDKAGQEVKLGITRGGTAQTVNVKLEDRVGKPLIGIAEARVFFGRPGPQRNARGPAHQQQFAKATLHSALFVDEVAAGSPAEKSGIVRGDIILNVDGKPAAKVLETVASHKAGETIKVTYLHHEAAPAQDKEPGAKAPSPEPKTIDLTLGNKDGKAWIGIVGQPLPEQQNQEQGALNGPGATENQPGDQSRGPGAPDDAEELI